MAATRKSARWFGLGLIVVSLILSFVATLDASQVPKLVARRSGEAHGASQSQTLADASTPLPPTVTAPFDWFNGPFPAFL
jgi:hypothetical protein